jgi:polyisoprenoid-binding protein YceI
MSIFRLNETLTAKIAFRIGAMLAKAFALFAVTATAFLAPAPLTFDMKDPKGVSGLTFAIDSPLEPIKGHSSAISGNFVFDPANPEKSGGTIIVQSADVHVNSPVMTDHMHQAGSLDVAKYPTIEFTIKKVENVKKTGENGYEADVTGDFTLHGVTKSIQVKASATHAPGALSKRGGVPNKEGDIIILRTKFNFNRSDFGVGPAQSPIGDKVEVDLSAAGFTSN